MKWPLHWQIFAAMASAWVFQSVLGESASFMEPLGEIFIRLLKMVVVPLIILSVMHGVAGVGDPVRLGRLGLKTLMFYMATSFLGIITGLTLVNLIQPGAGVELTEGESFSPESLQKPESPVDLLVRMIPLNPFAAAADGDMLGLIFFSILMGVGLTQISDRLREPLMLLLDGSFAVVMKVTQGIIRLAPIGVFGLIVRMLNQDLGTDFYKAVGWYMATIASGLSIHLLITLPLIYFFFTRRNPYPHFKRMSSALATVFATSSSLATLPVTMECVEKNAGVSNRITSFVLPLGATINMDGTALFECVGVLFIAQTLGASLGFEQQVLVVLTALLASIGAAAVPSSGLVMIFIVLDAVGLQSELIPLIVGTMMSVDRPLDMMRGLVNVFSDSVGAVVIAKTEGELRPSGGGASAGGLSGQDSKLVE